MGSQGNQRWCCGRDTYRRPDEVIATHRYEVAELPDDTTPRAFVLEHHYSGTYPAARVRFGLFRGGELVGVAVFSQPCSDAVLLNALPLDHAQEGVELGRFVLLDEVPGNGETWFLGRCFAALRRRGFRGVVSFSDPVSRTSEGGAVVFPGHLGTIYQAHNARYLGRATPRTLRLLPDGRVFSARAQQKIRSGRRGWRYATEQLVAAGAPEPEGCPRAWLRRALQAVTRTLRHHGNHRYAWPLDKHARRAMAAGAPYPKVTCG